MKIISWNVNGLRAIAKKGFVDFLNQEKPDIIALQEIKISENKRNLERFDFADYEEFWNSAERPGYSGTLILYKKNLKILDKKIGLKIKKFDIEGRLQAIELDKFYFINTYFPNSNNILSRLPYKLEFNEEVLKYLKKLEKKKPIIITGDFNVAHQEIDLARPKANDGSAGFTKEERDWMTKFLNNNYIDTFRYLNPKKIQYSWWSFRAGARNRNVGWRIDYFCTSKKIINNIKKSYILDKVLGSDHAPIGLETKI
ncbi:exodeoxyribonuclease III [Candidatus Falkowbacteria bacterium HGW-Falkowbacteria-1]|jgi:exodeoxyribonuclease-3|uniref:Exodeoxyribonuclease III n=1 Tax=Candidatus Falkowbacteria bacterium HGW-Falkowbacteria-1 TaxID=2013768 RepID=A0A2N2E8N4_9BACT|nr:MAG: exodeoxyribonuclease III [Candidatus Falkowbacteria bacterium HGW-Falkowbacteria-1]